jgi:hypothetical protein
LAPWSTDNQGCEFSSSAAENCSSHDRIFFTGSEVEHAIHEGFLDLSTISFTIRANAGQVSNTSPGMIKIDVNDSLAFWQDGVETRLKSVRQSR